MHDWLTSVLADSTASDSTSLKVAIVAALAVVLAAAIPALLSTREREPRSVRDARTDMRATLAELRKKTAWQDDYIEALEADAYLHGRDPRTLKPEGEPE